VARTNSKSRKRAEAELEAAGLIPPKAERRRREAEGRERASALVGQRIVKIRPMRAAERSALGWGFGRDGGGAVVIELESGALLFPSRDEEGNDSGVIFAQTPGGEGGALFARSDYVVFWL
jgi:hypothetical protein